MVELRSDEASQNGPVRPATATSAVGVIRVLLTVLRSLPVFRLADILRVGRHVSKVPKAEAASIFEPHLLVRGTRVANGR